MDKLNNYEFRILKALKDFGRLPTARIGGIIGMNFAKTKETLLKLNKEKKVDKQEETNSVYWEIKNEKKKI